jgi:hypothetical protein
MGTPARTGVHPTQPVSHGSIFVAIYFHPWVIAVFFALMLAEEPNAGAVDR